MSSDLSFLHGATLLDLYASAADPARWPRALDQICLQMGAGLAAAIAFSYDDGRTRIHWNALDSRTGLIQFPMDSNVPSNSNPRLDQKRALRGLNRIVGDEVLFDAGDEALAHLQQQMAAAGYGRFLGSLQEVSPGVFLALHLHRAIDDQHDFSTAQIASLAALMPHLGQAFVLTDRLQALPTHDRRVREHLEGLRCGMVFCDAEAQVHWLNGSAKRLLKGGPLRLVGSRLVGDTEDDTTKLMNELAEAASAGGNTARYLRLGLGLGNGEEVLHMAIQASARPSTIVLTLTCPSRGASIPTDALIRLFGLTRMQARLVAALATGSTLEQYAQQYGVSVATARVQLKHANVRTGTKRQSELVQLVWSSAAAYLSSGGDDLGKASKDPKPAQRPPKARLTPSANPAPD
jgi:DNA-binding CsgD family transcriptional regulator